MSAEDFVSLKENLIYKVAFFIRDKYQVKSGVNIRLSKNIPIAGGLGGGSSNAAQTIIALNELWNLKLTKMEQHDLARQFGSDINFFLEGGTALGEGRGEIISPTQTIELDNIFLVNPGFGISSREAYEAVNISGRENDDWKLLLETGKVEYCCNALESGVCRRYPEIQHILDYLREHGAAKAILSGSGATVVGFCPDRDIAENFAEYFRRKKYWNCITKTIKRRTK